MKVRGVLSLSICCALTVASTTTSAQAQRMGQTAAPRPDEHEKDMIKRGEALFNKQCPICHLGRPSKTRPFVGRNLRGILKSARPAQEKTVLDYILKGGEHMPGFQYNMTPDQIDDLMRFLKTHN